MQQREYTLKKEPIHFMTSSNFQEIITALVTPFKEEGALDRDGLQFLIERQLNASIDAILILGTTGEAHAIHSSERTFIIQDTVKRVGSRAQIWVGASGHTLDQTREYIQEAKQEGATCALIAPPSYILPTEEGIYAYMEKLQEAEFPLCFYHIPKRVGVKITASTLLKIAELPFVKALKECSGDSALLMDVIKAAPPIKIYAGDDGAYLAAAALGAHGLISVASNIYPKKVKELAHLLQQEKFKEARVLFYTLLPLLKELFKVSNPIGVKKALTLLHLPAGTARAPLDAYAFNVLSNLQDHLWL